MTKSLGLIYLSNTWIIKIEKANMAELDWALANMGGSKSKRQTKSVSEEWVAEAEAKGLKDKDDVS